MNETQKIMYEAECFVGNNLRELCVDMMTLSKTGVIHDSAFRDLEAILKKLDASCAFSIAQSLINRAAIEYVVDFS